MQVRSFSQLRRELGHNNLFYLDTSGKGNASSTLIPIDPSKAPSVANELSVTGVDKDEYERKLKRVDSAPEEIAPNSYYARGKRSIFIDIQFA